MVVLPRQSYRRQSQFVIGAYPATTGACQRLMISCDFWPQLELEMKRWQQNSKMVC